MASLKLIQLNIERDKHLDRIFPFIRQEKPDILCVQEIADHTVSKFEKELGLYSHFVPMNKRSDDGVPQIQGIAIFSATPFTKTWAAQYAGSTETLPTYQHGTSELKHSTQRYMLAFAEVEKDGVLFRIATTHFPWTADGNATDFQHTDMQKLISVLDETGECVLAGDFNAPRGGEIFSMLANKYTDNVPKEYTTSIDGTLHKAGPLPYMVDGIFSSPGYRVRNVKMHSGISDHCAFSATGEKVGR